MLVLGSVGILLSYWGGLFSGATLVLGSVTSYSLAFFITAPGLKVVPTKVRSPKFGVRSLWGKTGLFNGPLEFTHMTHMTYNIT